MCFFHPLYDTQGHILADAPSELRDWLRVSSPDELRSRVEYLNQHRDAWLWLVRAQRAHYDMAVAEARHLRLIDERIDGT